MKITWYGHSCFGIESAEGSVILDPYAPGSVPGYQLPALQADRVLCSHEHADHFCPEAVTLSGKKDGLQIRMVASYHDDVKGKKRGNNNISVIFCENLTAVHLGDLGHALSPEQIEQIGKTDILMIPVGGFYTVDAQQAFEICEALHPGIIIPMHFREEGRGYEVLATAEEFLKLFDKSRILRKADNQLEPDASLYGKVVLLSPNAAEE